MNQTNGNSSPLSGLSVSNCVDAMKALQLSFNDRGVMADRYREFQLRFDGVPDISSAAAGRGTYGVAQDLPTKPNDDIGRMAYCSSYASWKYTVAGQRERAARAFMLLMQAMEHTDCRNVVVHGTSGEMLVGALLLEFERKRSSWEPNIIMVRKPGSDSHGALYECSDAFGGTLVKEYIFLDDFVASGSTVRRVRDMMGPAKMVAVVLHSKDYEGADVRLPDVGRIYQAR